MMKTLDNIIFFTFIIYFKCSYCKINSNDVNKNSNDFKISSHNDQKTLEALMTKCKDYEHEDLIGCLMNEYLTSHGLKANNFCKSNDVHCHQSVKRYTSRCSLNSRKCFLLDNISLVTLSDGIVYVPDLYQLDLANILFKKSGAYKHPDLVSFNFTGDSYSFLELQRSSTGLKSSKDSKSKYLDSNNKLALEKLNIYVFNNTLIKRNIAMLGVRQDTDFDLLREIVYYSVVYFDQHYIHKKFADNHRSIFNFYSNFGQNKLNSFSNGLGSKNNKLSKSNRSGLFKTRRKYLDATTNKNLINMYVSYIDMNKLFDYLLVYLEQKPDVKSRALSFMKTFRYTFVKSVPYYKHNYMFQNYVLKKRINISDYSDNCNLLLNKYLDRCAKGECYKFDDYKLLSGEPYKYSGDNTASSNAFSDPFEYNQPIYWDVTGDSGKGAINYFVPDLCQIDLVYQLLAKKKGNSSSFFTKSSDNDEEIQFMAPRLLKINMKKFKKHENDTYKVIQAFLYYATIYHTRLHRDPSSGKNKNLNEWSVKNKLKAFLINEGKGRKLLTTEEEIKNIFQALNEYLSRPICKKGLNNTLESKNMIDKFTKTAETVLLNYHINSSQTCCIK